jgi:hypothetical protein
MSAGAIARRRPDPIPRCLSCGGSAEFGYRDKQTGELIWYCAAHRLGQFYADARLSEILNALICKLPHDGRVFQTPWRCQRRIDPIPAWMVPDWLAWLIERIRRRRPLHSSLPLRPASHARLRCCTARRQTRHLVLRRLRASKNKQGDDHDAQQNGSR